MIKLEIKEQETFISKENRFVKTESKSVTLCHSLISISKWESIWEERFLNNSIDNENEQQKMLSYISCMIIGKSLSIEYLKLLWSQNHKEIETYINSKQTATTIKRHESNQNTPSKRSAISSEMIYHWMIEWGIPWECERWHINRLLTLIELRSVLTKKREKVNEVDYLKERKKLNAARKNK